MKKEPSKREKINTTSNSDELKKKELHDILEKGIQDVREGKTTLLTQDLLDSWNKRIDNA